MLDNIVKGLWIAISVLTLWVGVESYRFLKVVEREVKENRKMMVDFHSGPVASSMWQSPDGKTCGSGLPFADHGKNHGGGAGSHGG